MIRAETRVMNFSVKKYNEVEERRDLITIYSLIVNFELQKEREWMFEKVNEDKKMEARDKQEEISTLVQYLGRKETKDLGNEMRRKDRWSIFGWFQLELLVGDMCRIGQPLISYLLLWLCGIYFDHFPISKLKRLLLLLWVILEREKKRHGWKCASRNPSVHYVEFTKFLLGLTFRGHYN